jgi:hypothetical protein
VRGRNITTPLLIFNGISGRGDLRRGMGITHYNYKKYTCDLCLKEIDPPEIIWFIKEKGVVIGSKFILTTGRELNEKSTILICERCRDEIKKIIANRKTPPR